MEHNAMLVSILALFSQVLQVTHQRLLWSYPNDSTKEGIITVIERCNCILAEKKDQ